MSEAGHQRAAPGGSTIALTGERAPPVGVSVRVCRCRPERCQGVDVDTIAVRRMGRRLCGNRLGGHWLNAIGVVYAHRHAAEYDRIRIVHADRLAAWREPD